MVLSRLASVFAILASVSAKYRCQKGTYFKCDGDYVLDDGGVEHKDADECMKICKTADDVVADGGGNIGLFGITGDPAGYMDRVCGCPASKNFKNCEFNDNPEAYK